MWARQRMEEEILQNDMGNVDRADFEERNMFHTDARDRAADRDAEAHEIFIKSRDVIPVEADAPILEERLGDAREQFKSRFV